MPRVVIQPIERTGPNGDRDPNPNHPYRDYQIHVIGDHEEVSSRNCVHKVSGFDNWWTHILPKDDVLNEAKGYARRLAKTIGAPGIVLLHKQVRRRRYRQCDCTCADECPQGKVGTQSKCRILVEEDVD